MDGCELALAITGLANTLASGLSDNELSLAAAAFSQLGDTLATIAAHRTICQQKADKPKDDSA